MYIEASPYVFRTHWFNRASRAVSGLAGRSCLPREASLETALPTAAAPAFLRGL